jgi:tRNA guanosine-2'-O-methyltransferase
LEPTAQGTVTSVLSTHQVDKDSFVRKQAFYVLTISLSIFTSSGNDGSQHCSSKSSAALPAQTKSNTATTKRERWANKEAKSLGVREMDQSDERCSNGLDRWKIFLLLYEMLQEYGTHLVEAAWTLQVSWFPYVSLIKSCQHYGMF